MMKITPPSDGAETPPPTSASSPSTHGVPAGSKLNYITGKIISSLDASRPVDVHVGQRLRQRRTILGFSQEKLGAGVGLTLQHIQKYEHGTSHIRVSRLYQLAKLLGVEISYFFDEIPSFDEMPDEV